MSWAAVAAAAVGVVGGAMSSRQASKTQANAANQASQLSDAQFQQNRQDYAPWRSAGTQALNQLLLGMGMSPVQAGQDASQPSYNTFDAQAYLQQNPDVAAAGMDPWEHYQKYGQHEGRFFTAKPQEQSPNVPTPTTGGQGLASGDLLRDFSLTDFQKDPGYDFRQREGMRAMEGGAAARGGLLSGGALKALNRYNQEFASQEFGNAYNRFNADRDRRFNRLSSVAGLGQTATRDVAQMGTQNAMNIGSNMMQGANARASGYMGIGNAITSGVNNYLTLSAMRPQSQTAPTTQGITGTGMAGDAAMYYSDRRLKTNIQKVGEEKGLNVYSFNYVWGGPEHVGYMADEVRLKYPDAVIENANGFLMVDYSKV